jgi:hypothetical protein
LSGQASLGATIAVPAGRYVEPIEEEAKKLEALNEQRSGMVHRLKMTEKDRDSLEDSKVREQINPPTLMESMSTLT